MPEIRRGMRVRSIPVGGKLSRDGVWLAYEPEFGTVVGESRIDRRQVQVRWDFGIVREASVQDLVLIDANYRK